MPQPAVRFDTGHVAAPSRPARGMPSAQPVIVSLGEGDFTWSASPARQLHDRLLQSFSEPTRPKEAVLSRRQRLLILVGSVALLWSLIGTAAVAIFR